MQLLEEQKAGPTTKISGGNDADIATPFAAFCNNISTTKCIGIENSHTPYALGIAHICEANQLLVKGDYSGAKEYLESLAEPKLKSESFKTFKDTLTYKIAHALHNGYYESAEALLKNSQYTETLSYNITCSMLQVMNAKSRDNINLKVVAQTLADSNFSETATIQKHHWDLFFRCMQLKIDFHVNGISFCEVMSDKFISILQEKILSPAKLKSLKIEHISLLIQSIKAQMHLQGNDSFNNNNSHSKKFDIFPLSSCCQNVMYVLQQFMQACIRKPSLIKIDAKDLCELINTLDKLYAKLSFSEQAYTPVRNCLILLHKLLGAQELSHGGKPNMPWLKDLFSKTNNLIKEAQTQSPNSTTTTTITITDKNPTNVEIIDFFQSPRITSLSCKELALINEGSGGYYRMATDVCNNYSFFQPPTVPNVSDTDTDDDVYSSLLVSSPLSINAGSSNSDDDSSNSSDSTSYGSGKTPSSPTSSSQ
jgi:hypothetical protein